MEQRMKADVLAEMKKYGGRVLLHEEESLPGSQAGLAIVPVWETVHPDDVMTPRELFAKEADIHTSIPSDGIRGEWFDYLRVPITDEQAPIPKVFDALVERIVHASKTKVPSQLMFNCQMGRGRTTTGMVITALVHSVLLQSASSDALVAVMTSGADPPNDEDASNEWNPGVIEITEDDEDEEEHTKLRSRYLRGEYKIITQLVAVLLHGKLAKIVADACIDAAAHMQNLRDAILDYKTRVENLAPKISNAADRAKYISIREIALNYLVRYFYLISFSGYLLEMAEGGFSCPRTVVTDDGNVEHSYEGDAKNYITQGGLPYPLPVPFSTWLAERREITSILERSNQDLG
jgi:hypothetical protein